MPATTYTPADGNRVVLGNFGQFPNAVIFLDLSDTAVHYAVPSGYNFSFDYDTTSEWTLDGNGYVFNVGGVDRDIRFAGLNNDNMILIDGGLDAVSFGGVNVAGAAFILNNLTTRAMVTSIGRELHMPSQTLLVSNACGTLAVGAAMFLGTPTLDQSPASGTDLTITEGATLYIAGALTGTAAAVVVTVGHALWLDGGSARIDGTLQLGNAGTDTGVMTLEGATSGTVTLTVSAAAGTTTLSLPTAAGTCGQQLTTNGAGGLLSWAAASLGAYKSDLGLVCIDAALDNILATPVHHFRYDPAKVPAGQWAPEYEFTGVFGEEARWAMQGQKREVFSPINSVGMLIAAVQGLSARLDRLEQVRA